MTPLSFFSYGNFAVVERSRRLSMDPRLFICFLIIIILCWAIESNKAFKYCGWSTINYSIREVVPNLRFSGYRKCGFARSFTVSAMRLITSIISLARLRIWDRKTFKINWNSMEESWRGKLSQNYRIYDEKSDYFIKTLYITFYDKVLNF